MSAFEGVFLASPFRRWAASATDALFLLLAHLIPLSFVTYFSPDPLLWLTRMQYLSPIACWCYLWWGWSSGQTPGKQLWRVRVIAADGEPMNARRALYRVGGYALACLPLKVGFLPILSDPLRRGWHDRLAKTLVVDDREPLPTSAVLKSSHAAAAEREARAKRERPLPVAPDFSVAWRGWPLVFAAYLALSVVLTWPVAQQLSSALAGDGGDAWVFVWNNWYFSHALQTGAPLLSTNLLFYPSSVPLLFHTMNWFDCALAWPLLHFFSPVETYNLLFLLTPALCAFAAYWLSCGLTRARLASFLVAPVFGFSPYFMMHGLGHANLTSAQFLPVFAGLFYAALLDGRARTVLGAGVALALAGLCDWQYLLFGTFVAVALWIGVEWSLRRAGQAFRWQRLASAASALAVCGVLLAPMLIPLARESRSASYMKRSTESGTFTIAVSSWLTPGKLNPVLSKHNPFNSVETNVTPGFCILALCALPLCWRRGREQQSAFLPWFVAGVAAFVFAFGPTIYLHGGANNALIYLTALGAPGNGLDPPWNTTQILDWANRFALSLSPFESIHNVELPFNWLTPYLPGFKAFRVPPRMSVLVLMCCAPFAAVGLQQLLSAVRQRRAAIVPLVALGLMGLMIFEYAPWPFPTSDISVPAFYQRIAHDPQNYAVVDVPVALSQRYGGWQVTHEKATIVGIVSRCPPQAFALAAHNPLLRALSSDIFLLPNEPIGKVPGPGFDYGPALRELQKLDVRYFVVHKKLDASKMKLLDHLHLPVAFDDTDTRVYRVIAPQGALKADA